jgi:hypothetical protein
VLRQSVRRYTKFGAQKLCLAPSQSAPSSLQFKKIGQLWSARVGLHHRALAAEDGEGFIWVWIGTHAEYERLIK